MVEAIATLAKLASILLPKASLAKLTRSQATGGFLAKKTRASLVYQVVQQEGPQYRNIV